MNGAILDLNLLLGKVAEMVFILYLHVLKKVFGSLLYSCCILVWIDLFPLFLFLPMSMFLCTLLIQS